MAEKKKRRFIPYGIIAGFVIGLILDLIVQSAGALIVTGIIVGGLVDLVIFLISRGHLKGDGTLT